MQTAIGKRQSEDRDNARRIEPQYIWREIESKGLLIQYQTFSAPVSSTVLINGKTKFSPRLN
jgi:hypothetical protein